MQLLSRLLLHPEQPGRVGLARQRPFTAPGEKLGLRLEAALVGSGAAGLVPDAHAAPGEAGGLQRITEVTGNCRQSLNTIIKPPGFSFSKHKAIQRADQCK